jgi:CRP/FNR family transcriptional regulator, cyclic AMP receptor protein
MATTPDFLRAIEFFRGFSEESLGDLSRSATTATYHRGDVVFAETDDANHLYIVQSGRIAISNKSVDGRESVLALMGPGDLFGEMALFDEQGRSAGARSLETSEVHSIAYGPLREYFERDAKALWNVVRLLIARVRAADEALADSVFLDVTGRTAKRLLDIAAGKDEFTLPITQEELAGMIGASRERVNKAIAAFVRLGWLEQRDRTYRIVERKKMTNRAS